MLSSARSSLIDIKRIADAASKWRNKDHYEANASEVIGLITRLGLKDPALLEWMINIETLESARFEGRISSGSSRPRQERDRHDRIQPLW